MRADEGWDSSQYGFFDLYSNDTGDEAEAETSLNTMLYNYGSNRISGTAAA